jgi:hypothetical protein
MTYAFLFGRLPELSHLELQVLESSFGLHGEATSLRPEVLLVNHGSNLERERLQELQARLGGVIRIMRITQENLTSNQVAKALQELSESLFADATGKVNIGVSLWGTSTALRGFDIARGIKSKLTEKGMSVRFITAPAQGPQLSTAQLVHNKLPITDQNPEEIRNAELIAIETHKGWAIGFTETVQDITSYTKRDFGIPRPDAESGMLPPKLAQLMINLATRGEDRTEKLAVYDPFCGNGRVVLESALMGITAFGSDLAHGKVTAAQENYRWQHQEFGLNQEIADPNRFIDADATKPDTIPVILAKGLPKPYVIATEPYLGKPLRAALSIADAKQWVTELVPLYDGFLTSLSSIQHADRPRRIMLIFPRVITTDGSDLGTYDTLVDRVQKLGYSAQRLFCYDRPDSFVRRDLVELTFL